MMPARADLCGAGAIVLWSFTALAAANCLGIPPLRLAALSALGVFAIFAALWVIRGEGIAAHMKVAPLPLLFSVLGIGGYRLLYLTALATAPVVESSLINYLWPVLVVLFTLALPGHRLKAHHTAGAVLAFAGLAVLLYHPDGMFEKIRLGHFLALAAAILWAGYSVGTRTMTSHTYDAVPVSFLVSGLIMLALSLFFDPPVAIGPAQGVWIMILAAVAGFGYALWDSAMKHGHIQIIGVASYLIPLFSTLLLVACGKAEPATGMLVSVLLIVAGPLVASCDRIGAALNEWTESRNGGRMG